jgi:hypothetical protein
MQIKQRGKITMSLKQRLLKLLNSKKGNALLLATAGAIAATFSVYFFVSITTLSEASKQRVAHLYNAYQMGQSVKGKISGADMKEKRLDGSKTEDQVEAPLDKVFHNGKFITLQQMIVTGILIAADDPTASQARGSDIAYNKDVSGLLIKFADEGGSVITPTETGSGTDAKVRDLQLFVNLAGTQDADVDNGPYDLDTPFFYIVMATDTAIGDTGMNADYSAASLTDSSLTVDLTQFPTGILATNDGGPQAETSVILPQDYDEVLE